MTALLAGLVLGLAGSLHCAGMCGPLVVLAHPRRRDTTAAARARHVALYHAGRLATYVILGTLAGLAAGALAGAGVGRVVALAAGITLIAQALALTGRSTRVGGGGASGGALARLGGAVTRALARVGTWMRAHRVQGPLAFGALNGLLPCGLLYAALTAAAGFGTPLEAMVCMAAFAVGTTPVLALVAPTGGALIAHAPGLLRRAAPAALAIVGVLLIVRGVAPLHDHVPAAHASAGEHRH